VPSSNMHTSAGCATLPPSRATDEDGRGGGSGAGASCSST
jgi:hypothetical protein